MHLTVSQLCCRRGGRTLFSQLSFSLGAGQGLLLEGPNGSGKTTLLRALCGLFVPDDGSIALRDGADELFDEQMHYAGHKEAIKPSLTIMENLVFWAKFLEGGDVEAALGLFDLAPIAHLPVQFLSAGQKRKLALSRLVLVHRPLWLLDEPSVSLDENARSALATLMEAHIKDGGMIIAATHADLGVTFEKQLRLGMAQAVNPATTSGARPA